MIFKTVRFTAISSAVVLLALKGVFAFLAGDYITCAAAIGGIILAYNPGLAELFKQVEPFLPGWLAWLAGLLANIPALLRKLIPTPPPTPPSPHA